MSDKPQPGVIGSLPRTRPHRRSNKRAAPPAGAAPVDAQSAAEPAVVKAAAPRPKRAPKAKAQAKRAPTAPRLHAVKPAPTATSPAPGPAKPTVAAPPEPAPADAPHGVLETAVQAAAELAEIGLHASARALRRAASRLPRP
jgi:hypothetical protein